MVRRARTEIPPGPGTPRGAARSDRGGGREPGAPRRAGVGRPRPQRHVPPLSGGRPNAPRQGGRGGVHPGELDRPCPGGGRVPRRGRRGGDRAGLSRVRRHRELAPAAAGGSAACRPGPARGRPRRCATSPGFAATGWPREAPGHRCRGTDGPRGPAAYRSGRGGPVPRRSGEPGPAGLRRAGSSPTPRCSDSCSGRPATWSGRSACRCCSRSRPPRRTYTAGPWWACSR